MPSPSPDAPVVVAARRTFVGGIGRGFAAVEVHELAAAAIRGAHADARAAGLDAPVTDVVLGNCTGPGGNLGRMAALAAGLGHAMPGMAVDRQCGSGLAAVLVAAHAVRAGETGGAGMILAGGAESASTAPVRSRRARGADVLPVPFTRAPFAPPGFPDPEMGPAADALARRCGITRERQDEYAARSHARVLAAHAGGRFDREVVRIGDLERDEHARVLGRSTLARLRPAFTPDGTVTAGSSSPVSDGSAVVAVVADSSRGRAPGLRIVHGAVVGCDPALPGWGPVPAVNAVLARAGLDLGAVAAVEIVEAFAAQVLAATDALGLDVLGSDGARVCPDGGAIALGHPWGASGAIAMTRLFARLVSGGAPTGTLGLATAAVGGGMGVALLVEVVR